MAAFSTKDGPITANRDICKLVLTRADPDFHQYPEQVAITVVDMTGKPVVGAEVFNLMRLEKYHNIYKTDAAGLVSVRYSQCTRLGVHDEKSNLLGFLTAPPSELQRAKTTIVLKAACKVQGKLECPALTQAGLPLRWTNVYLELETGGKSVVQMLSREITNSFCLAELSLFSTMAI
jgi:hypothetical protein